MENSEWSVSEEEYAVIEKICQTAGAFAPGYDAEKIREAMKSVLAIKKGAGDKTRAFR